MSDEFKITGPGFYRQRDGGRAEVLVVRGDRWYGTSTGDAVYWWVNGRYYYGADDSDWDIVGPWTDPPEPIPEGRAEFPQGPPTPPATPWTQEDVPFPALVHCECLGVNPSAIVGMDERLVYLSQHGNLSYDELYRLAEWSPDNVTWHPCTREAVAEWRQRQTKGASTKIGVE